MKVCGAKSSFFDLFLPYEESMSESLVNLLLLLLSDQRFLYIRIFDDLHTINSRLPKIHICVLDRHQDESWARF